MVQFTGPGGRFNAQATTLKSLLEWAYGIQPSQHSGGPQWIATDCYDVIAKAEGNATDDQMRLMVQTLLADRFQLKFHREKKELSVYVISLGKTPPRLVPAKDGETHFLRAAPQMGPDQKIASYHVVGTRFSIEQLADVFARQLGSVIVDKTGLLGEFDFSLDLMPDDSRPSPIDPSLLIGGMKDQLGLTVRSQKTPVDVLVIDSAEKVAAGN